MGGVDTILLDGKFAQEFLKIGCGMLCYVLAVSGDSGGRFGLWSYMVAEESPTR